MAADEPGSSSDERPELPTLDAVLPLPLGTDAPAAPPWSNIWPPRLLRACSTAKSAADAPCRLRLAGGGGMLCPSAAAAPLRPSKPVNDEEAVKGAARSGKSS